MKKLVCKDIHWRVEHLFAQIAPNIALENLGSGVMLLEDRENTRTHTYTQRIKKTVAVVNCTQTIYRIIMLI